MFFRPQTGVAVYYQERSIHVIGQRVRATGFWFALLILLAVSGCSVLQQPGDKIHPAKSLPATTPWDLAALSSPPDFQWADTKDPIWSLYYQGESYQGKPTRVFAYYSNPAILEQKQPGETKYPAVVLIHGGGGTAFKEWVELWARRGYAAIAMDLAGCGPERKRLEDGGPGQTDVEKFGAIDQPAENQWTYHAVANVILAHSLIRSFPEIDPQRTAVTGISWGGYLTCIVAGLDNRFKAAVPVYGCGFLQDNSVWLTRFAKMTPQQRDKWVQLWDPSMYVGSAAMPVFFVNGTNDFAYPLDSYAKTYRLTQGPRNYRITVKMPHGHPQGWEPEAIGLFVDQYLIGGIPLPTIMKPEIISGHISAAVKSETPLISATLHYTTGTVPINKLSWQNVPAYVIGKQIILLPPPEEAAIWFLTVQDSRGAIVSSELVFSTEKK